MYRSHFTRVSSFDSETSFTFHVHFSPALSTNESPMATRLALESSLDELCTNFVMCYNRYERPSKSDISLEEYLTTEFGRLLNCFTKCPKIRVSESHGKSLSKSKHSLNICVSNIQPDELIMDVVIKTERVLRLTELQLFLCADWRSKFDATHEIGTSCPGLEKSK
jgi:hypothetical protein